MNFELDEDWEEWDPTKGSLIYHMIAGSAAGVSEHLAMYPFDTYKTHCQTSIGEPEPFTSFVRNRGLARMWRGAPAMFFACIPSHAAYFSVYEYAKASLGVNEPGHHPLSAAAAGASATMLHDAVLTPMDMVKQRLQLGLYKGPLDCITSTLRTEGIRAFFRSYPTTVLMNIPYAATAVATNESLREVVAPSGEHNTLSFLLCGAASGAVAAAVTNPLDVVKTLLQTQRRAASSEAPRQEARARSVGKLAVPTGLGNSSARGFYTSSPPLQYIGLRDTVVKVFRKEGILGFSRGLRARLLIATPSMGISWATYETIKSVLIRDD